MFGESHHFFGDSHSYTGFKTWLETGTYTFDPTHPDARFGRVPGYPLFWGVHYLVFGDAVWNAVAFSQCILDTISTFLVIRIGTHLRSNAAGLIGGSIYAIYPPVLMWVPITGTEIFATFLLLLFFERLFRTKPQQHSTTSILFLGVLAAYSLLTREYLGLLLVCGTLYLAWHWEGRKLLLFGLTFLAIYSVWPLRNYLGHQELVLLRPANSGYHTFEADVYGVIRWSTATMDMGSQAVDPVLIAITEEGALPDGSVFANSSDEARAKEAAKAASECGRGFYYRKHRRPISAIKDCTDEIADTFDSAARNFRKAQPATYWLEIPLSILYKAIFKSSQVGAETPLYLRVIFLVRTSIIILGLVGLALLAPIQRWTLLAFLGSLHIFWMYIVRFLEMRYLIQSDAVFIVLCAVTLAKILEASGLAHSTHSLDTSQ